MSMGTDGVMRELPKYECHKIVHALKIMFVKRQPDGSAIIKPFDAGFAEFEVDAEYVEKHKPIADGYYVVYADGYRSFSPAKAFEDGYTLVK